MKYYNILASYDKIHLWKSNIDWCTNIHKPFFEERMEEMKELALACDIEICMSISQNLEHPHKSII